MKTSHDIPKASGIYRISVGPRTFYWGQSNDLYRRAQEHLSTLVSGTHHNQQIQRSFDKYGESAYTYEVSLLCPVDDLNMQEQFVLDIWHGTPGCANIAKCAEEPARGLKRSAVTCARIAAAKTGVPRKEETRRRISESLRGERHPNFGKKLSRLSVERGRVSRNKKHPNILVLYANGGSSVWLSQNALSRSLGYTNAGAVGHWLAGRQPIPAKYNILSISRTELPVTINPEAI